MWKLVSGSASFYEGLFSESILHLWLLLQLLIDDHVMVAAHLDVLANYSKLPFALPALIPL